MRFLFFDTALNRLTAGVALDTRIVAAHSEYRHRGHADRLVPLLRDLMAMADVTFADLDGIGCTCGPGTFTGIRSGVAAARALGLAANLPATGVTTLDALAHTAIGAAGSPVPVTAAIDARRGELYLRNFRSDGTPDGPPMRLATADVGAHCPAGHRLLVGTGASLLRDVLGRGTARPDIGAPTAQALVATLGRALRPLTGKGYRAGPKPLYLRPADATPPADWRQPPTAAC